MHDHPSSDSFERPGIFTLGVVLTAGHAAFVILALIVVTFLGWIGFGVGASQAHGDEAGAIVLVGGLFSGLICCIGVLQSLCIPVALLAWRGSRFWIWVLIVLSAIGITNAPIGTIIGVITIIGCAQALDRLPR